MTDSPYDTRGYDAAGYDVNGYDAAGYDRSGYDGSGYDRSGYDRHGYDGRGYDASGFNRAGYDVYGYNRAGYDASGLDRSGLGAHGGNRTSSDLNHAYGAYIAPDSPQPIRSSTRSTGGDGDVQVGRMIAGGVATVVVGALTAAVVCWLFQAIRTNMPAETWQRIGAPHIPDPATAAILGGGMAAAAAAVALALTVFVSEGLKFFRIVAVLVTVVWIVAVASEHSWSTWLITAAVVGIPGLAIMRLAPSVRPTLRP